MLKIRAPGSKSYTNRALILAALTEGSVALKNPLYAEDTEAMIDCLRILGIEIETQPDQIVVHGDVSCIQEKEHTLFARDSGTTARFMLALLCIVPGTKTISGTPRLNQRPIRDLVDALRTLGAVIEYCAKEGELPVKISSSSLSGDSVWLKGNTSSQFYSALLLISPHISKEFKIHIEGDLISKPYADMTLNCMNQWQKKEHEIEGDYSSAAYFFAIAALTQSEITVENLSPNSLQADRKFLEILAQMGNSITYLENGVCVRGKQILPVEVDMRECPDQAMTVAVLAAFAQGMSKISGITSLRFKECERVSAVKAELGKMGINTEDADDALIIWGGAPRAAEIDTYNDHRIAMSFAVAAMKLPEITIRNPEVVNKTFPNFWEIWRSLR